MHPVLASCQLFLTVLRDLITHLRWTANATASATQARKFKQGLRLVEAYLRRVLIVMALEIEPTLVEPQTPMKRPHGRKAKTKFIRFRVFDDGCTTAQLEAMAAVFAERDQAAKQTKGSTAATAKLTHRLDYLAKIAADPLARAKRLAMHLARSRHGILLAPDIDLRPPTSWMRTASMSFTTLGYEIIEKSRSRPPPLPPPRRYGPSVLVLDG
jgi:hypothetical protein